MTGRYPQSAGGTCRSRTCNSSSRSPPGDRTASAGLAGARRANVRCGQGMPARGVASIDGTGSMTAESRSRQNGPPTWMPSGRRQCRGAAPSDSSCSNTARHVNETSRRPRVRPRGSVRHRAVGAIRIGPRGFRGGTAPARGARTDALTRIRWRCVPRCSFDSIRLVRATWWHKRCSDKKMMGTTWSGEPGRYRWVLRNALMCSSRRSGDFVRARGAHCSRVPLCRSTVRRGHRGREPEPGCRLCLWPHRRQPPGEPSPRILRRRCPSRSGCSPPRIRRTPVCSLPESPP